MLTLSLIIPVYNEERHLKACLYAISKQTDMPDEVLVIDNNCTDQSMEIARSYPFVRIIRENHQGLIRARNTGFTHAKSDIYGRIDADSQIDVDWVSRVKAQFQSDPDLYGVTGQGRTDIFPYAPWPRLVMFSPVYFWYIQFTMGLQVMWGANMAITARAWGQIKDAVCLDDALVHEDQDITILMQASGLKISLDNKLRITTSGQTYRYLPKLLYYRRLHINTKKLHKKAGTLAKAQQNFRISYATMPFKILLGLPVAILLWIYSIAFYPLDYLLLRARRGM